MAKKKLVLCDSNILIHVPRGRMDVKERMENIGNENICLSLITVAEIYAGANNKLDFAFLKKTIEKYNIFSINDEVSNVFHGLILNYTLSHHIQIPDAFIAATAIANGIEIYTENTGDFKFIPELKFYHAK